MNSWELVLALFSHLVSLILFFELFFFSFLWHVSHGTLKILNAIMCMMMMMMIMYHEFGCNNVYHNHIS
jgi:hypothetical protein